tara:strand:- start:17195 stop:17398 length:204 start_codon:yes stop_codon:yes gene_type:complete
MDSAKRLEQAVEKLEAFMKNNAEISAMDGDSNAKITSLMAENSTLKEKQDAVKLRLDALIKNAEGTV